LERFSFPCQPFYSGRTSTEDHYEWLDDRSERRFADSGNCFQAPVKMSIARPLIGCFPNTRGWSGKTRPIWWTVAGCGRGQMVKRTGSFRRRSVGWALIFAARRIRNLNFGKLDDPALVVARGSDCGETGGDFASPQTLTAPTPRPMRGMALVVGLLRPLR